MGHKLLFLQMLLLSTLWQKLIQFDQYLFIKINSGLANPFFDAIMPFIRNPYNWAPLYLFALVFVLLNFKTKGAWWALFFLVTVSLTDMIGNYVFKESFQRVRPCNDPVMADHVRLLLKQCGNGFSFVSNHAANHFGMAVFFFVTFRAHFKKWCWLVLAWASLVAFAQVYVGVHYPFDVLAGALLGLIFGLSTGTFFNKRFGIAIFDNQPSAN